MSITTTRPAHHDGDFVSQAMALDGPGSLARHDNPATSHQAADSISRQAHEASELYVLTTLRDHGPRSDESLFALKPTDQHWSPSRIRTARKQLVDKGLVRDSGLLAKTASGRNAIEWEAVA